MRPIDFKESNLTLIKPEEMTDEECSELRAHGVYKIFKEETGGMKAYGQIITCWELNLDDINAINNGSKIWVIITSTGMPPIGLQTEYPF